MKSSSVVFRILSLILVFFLGFLSCVGSLVGAGYLIYSKISYQKLLDWGIPLPSTEAYINADADKPLTGLTLSQLIYELGALKNATENYTVDTMLNTYGIILPEALDNDELRSIPVSKLFGADGTGALLDAIPASALFAVLPEGTLSEPAIEALGSKTLKEVAEGNLAYLLSGVHLGYIFGVNYVKEDGVYRPVFNDPEQPTLLELVAPVDLGELLDVFANGGDMMAVFRRAMGNVMLLSLIETIMGAPSDMIESLLDGVLIEDVLVMDEETGTYQFKLEAVMEGKLLGDLLGYTPVWSTTEPPFIIQWVDELGEPATGYMRGLAYAEVGALLGEEGMDPDVLFEKVYLGDLLNYTPVQNEVGEIIDWLDINGEPVNTAYHSLAMKSVKEMTSDDFDVNGLFEGIRLGDFYGYIYDEEQGIWQMENEDGTLEEVKGVDRVIANIDIGRMLGGDSGYNITDEFDGMLLGELLGYEKNADGEWVEEDEQGNSVPVTGMDRAIANIDFGKILSGEEYDITDEFNGMLLGEILGYEKNADGNWVEKDEYGNYTEVTGIDRAIANIDLGKLLGDSEYSVTDEFDGMYLGELLGYEKNADGEWLEESEEGTLEKVGAMESAIADISLGEMLDGDFDMASSFTDTFVGDMMEYTRGEEILPEGGVSPENPEDREYVWYTVDDAHPDTLVKVEGIEAKFANFNLYKLISGEETLDADTVTEGMTVAEILGLSSAEYVVCDKNGTPMQDGEGNVIVVTLWFDEEGAQASGVLGALAEKEFSDLTSEEEGIDSLPIGAILGQIDVGGTWYELGDPYEAEGENRVNATEAEGIMTKLADLTVGQLGDNDEVTDRIQSVKVHEAMGWKNVDGVWYTEYYGEDHQDNVEADGILLELAECELSKIEDEINAMQIGAVLGWTEVNGVWYETYIGEGSDENVPAEGIMKAIAPIAVEDLESEVDKIRIGEIMGWTSEPQVDPATGAPVVDADGKELYDWYEDAEKTKPASGVMGAFADLTVDELRNADKVSAVVKTVKVGEAMGWKYIQVRQPDGEMVGVWCERYNENTGFYKEATGTLGALADAEIGELESEIDKMQVGKLLGWEETADGWNDGTNDVTGLMKTVAGFRVDELGTRIDTIRIGTIMDWTPKPRLDGEGNPIVDADGKELNDWFEDAEKTKPATGIMAAFADLTVNEMSNANKVSAVVQTVKVGEAMGWKQVGEDWYEVYDEENSVHNVPVSGTLGALAGAEIGKLESEINKMQVGKLLGWTPTADGGWNDGTNDVKGLMKTVAGFRVDELGSGINGIKIGEIMGWTPDSDADNASWFVNPEMTEPASGIMVGFANLTMDEMSDAETVAGVVQGLRVGDAMGWYAVARMKDGQQEKDDEGNLLYDWYKSEDDLTEEGKAPGALGALANCKINALESEMMELDVGVVMGWTCETTVDHNGREMHQWYHDAAKTQPVTGFMNIIADHRIDEIELELQVEKAGVLLGYELWDERADGEAYDTVAYPDGWWHKLEKDENGNQIYDENGPKYVPVSKLEQKICSSTIQDMGYTMANLTIGDVYTINDPADAEKLNAALIGFGYLEEGKTWESMSIERFCDAVVALLVDLLSK